MRCLIPRGSRPAAAWRVAIIDSGVYAAHPHVGSVAGGVALDADGVEGDDYVDRLGHGTAVTAAIREKAPDAELYAVKVFHGSLSTSISTLVHAIDWAARSGMQIANLSLGTARIEHEGVLRDAVARASARGMAIVAAYDDEGVRWLPGSLPGVVPVCSWTGPVRAKSIACPARPARRCSARRATRVRFPAVPPDRNLSGISFAVANMTGFTALVRESAREMSVDDLVRALHVPRNAVARNG